MSNHINCYPLIYKKLVCDYYFAHKGYQKVSDIIKLFNISNGSLYNWLDKHKSNTLFEKQQYNKTSKYTPEVRNYIKSYVLKYCDFSYVKLMISIKYKFKIKISRSMLYSIIKSLNLTRKKFKQRILPDKNKHISKVETFQKQINDISHNDIICIDETSINTHACSKYGWSLKGKHIIKIHKKSKITYTIISAISNKKVIYNKIIKGSSDSIQFKDFLINVVNKLDSSKYLLMDNARIHHSKIIHEYMQTTNHIIIYNVPYCPEYNPIEMVFSKLKSIINKKDNSNQLKLHKNITNAFGKILKRDLNNFYKKSLTF
jgi:transposase